MVLLYWFVILSNIIFLRQIIAFVFLSFVPGYSFMRILKLKDLSFFDKVIFSLALSLASLMFVGLLVNEFYVGFGFSQPLSVMPLSIAITVFILALFCVSLRHNSLENLDFGIALSPKEKRALPLYVVLCILPIISAIGVLYGTVDLILISYLLIIFVCVLSFVLRNSMPENMLSFVILAVSIALACQLPLISKYIVGYDANLEYYVFRNTQINGYWGSLNTR